MARWKPDAMVRLAKAALELFAEQGYKQTSVAQIAQRAELTERTFFRYFTDKREVMFSGADILREELVAAIERTPTAVPPFEAMSEALALASRHLQHGWTRKYHAIVAASDELQERELIKMGAMASEVAEVLRRRGVRDLAAKLTAEAGVAVFKTAAGRWAGEAIDRDLEKLIRESFTELKSVTAGESAQVKLPKTTRSRKAR